MRQRAVPPAIMRGGTAFACGHSVGLLQPLQPALAFHDVLVVPLDLHRFREPALEVLRRDLILSRIAGTSRLVDEPNHISGATAATLVIVNTTESDEGSYHCAVSNALGSAESDAATLSVCDHLADLNRDAKVDIADLALLLSNFGRTDSPPRTDGNRDGDETVGLDDLAILLNDFGAACP